MSWKVHAEHPDSFEVHGNSGKPFHVKKHNLTPAKQEWMRAMCNGGSVKLAEGGMAAPVLPNAKPKDPPRTQPANSSPNLQVAKTQIDAHNQKNQAALQEDRFDDGGYVERAPQIASDMGGKIGGAIGGTMGNTGREAGAFMGRVAGDLAGQAFRGAATSETNAFFPANPAPEHKFDAKAALHHAAEQIDPKHLPDILRYVHAKVHGKADGGPVQPVVQKDGNQVKVAPGSPEENPEAKRRVLMGVQKPPEPRMADGGEVPPSELGPQYAAPQATQPADPNAPSMFGAVAEAFNPNPAAQAFEAEQQKPPPAPPEHLQRPPEEQQEGASAQSSTSFQMPGLPPAAEWGKLEKSLAEQQRIGKGAADQLAVAESQKADALTTAYSQHETDLRAAEEKRIHDTKAVQGQIDSAINDIQNTKIDPQHYWADKGEFGKLRAGLGMILSGIGSGLSGQPNMAAQFIQRGIDRDIEAQKANLSKKETLLGFMYKKYGNLQEAAQATRSYLLASLAGQVGLASARAGGPEAMAKAEMLKSELAHSALQTQATIINGRHQDAMTRYQMAFQQRMMSQFGMAAEPGYIPSGTPPPIPGEISLKGLSELQKTRGEQRVNLPEAGPNAHTYAPPHVAAEVNKTMPEFLTMENSLHTMELLGKRHPLGINSPLPDQSKEAFNVAHNALNLSMNRLMGQQRFTEEEQKLYGPMVASSSKFLFGKAGQANIQALRKLIQQKRMAEYQRLGLRVPGPPKEAPIAGVQ